MALRGTLTHRKTRILARELGVDPCFALGLLEALWHVTAEQRPSGDIGHMRNADIAMEMFYAGDPDQLVQALIKAGFLDVHPTYRLLIHDWHQHADSNTKRKVHRRRELIHTVNGDVQPLATADSSSPVVTSDKSIPEPEPVPEPVPEPEPDPPANGSGKEKISGKGSISSSKGKPSKIVDSRTAKFRSLFGEYYRKQVGKDAEWDGQEGAALKKFLSANPDINAEDWHTILNNRVRSPGLAHAVRLSAWIKNAKCWLNGPANKFGDPITGGEKNGRPTAQSKQDRTIDAINNFIAGMDCAGVGQDRDPDGRGDHEGAPVIDGERIGKH